MKYLLVLELGFILGVGFVSLLLLRGTVPWNLRGLDARCQLTTAKTPPPVPCEDGRCIQFLPEKTRYICVEHSWRPLIEG